MISHFLRAKEMRVRSEQCELSANQTTSEKFAECYRLLAENYKRLAALEQDYADREVAIIKQRELSSIELIPQNGAPTEKQGEGA